MGAQVSRLQNNVSLLMFSVFVCLLCTNVSVFACGHKNNKEICRGQRQFSAEYGSLLLPCDPLGGELRASLTEPFLWTETILI